MSTLAKLSDSLLKKVADGGGKVDELGNANVEVKIESKISFNEDREPTWNFVTDWLSCYEPWNAARLAVQEKTRMAYQVEERIEDRLQSLEDKVFYLESVHYNRDDSSRWRDVAKALRDDLDREIRCSKERKRVLVALQERNDRQVATITELQNRIAKTRQFYNDTIRWRIPWVHATMDRLLDIHQEWR